MLNQSELDQKFLVEKAKHDSNAFAELYDFYFPKIFMYISWRVGSQSDAEDLVSDIFIKVLNKLSSFKWQEGASFSSWIFCIAKNSLTDYYRTQHKRAYYPIEDLPEIEADEELPDTEYDRKILFNKLRILVDQLPERQSEIIRLRFFFWYEK